LTTIGNACFVEAAEQPQKELEQALQVEQKVSAADRVFFQELAQTSRLIASEAIAKKYQELLRLQGEGEIANRDSTFTTLDKFDQGVVSLKIFVSSSMSIALLKNYVVQARKAGASLIFKGLIDDSWTKTRELIFAIAGDGEPASILIHDGEFEEFGVTSVPTIVLVQEEDIANIGDEQKKPRLFDRVVGNIGIRSALELFADSGSLAEEAGKLLEARQ
jgi:type-F conjugative transfer system pilin assembly protein TrbC